jgi:hypothetical protein
MEYISSLEEGIQKGHREISGGKREPNFFFQIKKKK